MIRLIFLFLLSFCLTFAAWRSSSAFETSASSPNVVSTDTIKFLSFLPMPTITTSSVFSVDSFFENEVNPSQKEITPTPIPDFCMNIPVLLYHHTQPLDVARLLGHAQLTVDSNIFDEQIKYLAEHGYKTISAEDLIIALNSQQQLQSKTVVVTIDDGYDDNYTYAFSSAKKYGVVINFMIPTGLIGNPGYMTWEHLREMKDSPFARIYNHTWSHYALGGASLEKIEYEVMTANKQFEENLGIKPTIFTYPYGSYDGQVIDFLASHGFIGAFSTIEGSMQCKSQVMILQRIHIGNAPMNFYGF